MEQTYTFKNKKAKTLPSKTSSCTHTLLHGGRELTTEEKLWPSHLMPKMIVMKREAAEPDDAISHHSITTKDYCKDKRTAYQMCT